MNRPRRKSNRLEGYDYASCGCYFITFCTKEKACVLWNREQGCLSGWGSVTENTILEIPQHYSGIKVEHYVVMPNHVHLLLLLENDAVGIPTVINQLKGAITKRIGTPIWQKLYHDRIVRNDTEYTKIWNYIEMNPMKWELDCFYCK